MKGKLLVMLINMVIARLNADDVKKWVDTGLDMIEAKVIASATKYDDMVVLPLIATIRTAFAIDED